MKAEKARIESGLLSQLAGLAESHQWGHASALASAALAGDGDNGRLCEAVGLLEHAAQDFSRCRRRLESALHLVPLRPATWCALADCYVCDGLYPDAREIYAYVAGLPVSSVEILRYCASRLDAMSESARALEVARRVVSKQPDHAHSVYEFGYYLARSGATAPLVISVMKQAISLAPENATYRLGLAKVLAELGDIPAAISWVGKLSATQLDQITCRCCLERLAFLYQAGSDHIREHACRVRIENLPENSAPPATFDPYLLINEYLAEARSASHSEVAPVSLRH